LKLARDLMQAAVTVSPALGVRELAWTLLEAGVEGACVVDAGRLVGVITAMDLVHREAKVPTPSTFPLLDALIPVPGAALAEAERMFAARAGEAMSHPPITVTAEAPLEQVASLLVGQHLTVLPVISGERLLGMITKASLLRALWGERPAGA
jgi:CBS domain-containing protein